jgi:uncharacterized protein YutE (UPF0331/DUF86 family)
VLKRRVLEALHRYNGIDKEELREMCQQKVTAGEFNEEFANNVLKQTQQ